jgi:hypothetical protein
MNLARILVAIAAVAVVAGAFSFWLSADKTTLDDLFGNEVASVSVTRDALTPGANTDANDVVIVPLAPPAPVQVNAAPVTQPAVPAATAAEDRLQAMALESAVLAEVDEGPISAPAPLATSGDIKVDPPANNQAPATATSTTGQTQGDPIQVPPGTIVQLAAACGPAGSNCTKDLTVVVGDGLGGATVVSTGSGLSASVLTSTVCSSAPKVDFKTNPDGSWSYTLDAGCVKKVGSGGP